MNMKQSERVEKTFCTTREAAQLLGVSLRTAQLWVESGLLEAWKTAGGHRRITRTSVLRLLHHPVSHAEPPVENVSAEPTATPLTILVVEDEASLRRLYELSLARWPSPPRVVTAPDGYEALIRLGHERPDLLITDLMMPGLDGFRLLRTIARMPELQRLKTVVVTGLEPADIDERGGVPAGIPVLPKPIPFERLREIADSVAASRKPTE